MDQGGARYAKHWAYEKPVRPKVPSARNQSFIRNPIDSFVLQNLKEPGGHRANLRTRPVGCAESPGLIGLPPTVREIDAFLKDDSPNAREKVVDRLLASPRYGEHWARQWLDLARYADSNGFQADQLRDSWAFRDWVIEAMNADMPFDRFSIEQLAGDLLPESTVSQKIATGFHRTPTCNVEAGVHPEENRVNQVFDRVNATGLTWLGTTLSAPSATATSTIPSLRRNTLSFSLFSTILLLKYGTKVERAFPLTFGGRRWTCLGCRRRKEFNRLNSELASLKEELEAEEKKAEQEFPLWVKEMTKRAEGAGFQVPDWKVAPIEEASSDGKETFEPLEDGSVLATANRQTVRPICSN